jgi:hypothetical protein
VLRTDPSEEHSNPHLAARAKAIREQLEGMVKPCCETPLPSVCDRLASGDAKIVPGPFGGMSIVPNDER